MTMEERIERAAIDEWSHFESLKRLIGGNPIAWDGAHEEERQKFRNRIGWHLRAAFPELFTDPPTAWIAPWFCDDAMSLAAVEGNYKAAPERIHYQADFERGWDAMRDAYIPLSKIGERKRG